MTLSTVDVSAAPSALSIRDLRHSYVQRGALALKKKTSVEVLKGISLEIPAGKTLGLVGSETVWKTDMRGLSEP